MAVDNLTVAVVSRNTYQYNNSSIFFSLVNTSFLPYYQQVIRKSCEWLDGYDPSFHKDDMVSTRIGSKIFNGFTNAVFGRGLIYAKGHGNTEQSNEALNFISHEWNDYSDFQSAVKRMIGFNLPLGTAALKLNRSADGKTWVEPLRMDYFYFSVDGRKRATEFTSFIRCFQSTENKELNYFLVEKRFFKLVDKEFVKQVNGVKIKFFEKVSKPFVRYEVFKYEGMVNQDQMPNSIQGEGLNFKTLPDWVKKEINKNYSVIKVGEEQPLPYGDDYLGVELFFNESGDITNPTLPFGRPLCFDCIADFMEYDMEKSYSIRDLYNSKGIVGLPKALSQADLSGKAVPGTGGALHKLQDSAYSQLNIPGYEVIKGLDPNTQKPVITQFEIRAVEHEQKQMAILKSIAVTINVSPKAIASFLTTTTQATDDQIQSEDDTITQWIKSHRQDFIAGLNRIIECVLNMNGFSENVEVRFASDGLLKGDKQLDNIQKRLDMGMIDIEDAIREYYPDEDEEQLQVRIAKAKQRQQELVNQQYNELNDEGLFANDEI